MMLSKETAELWTNGTHNLMGAYLPDDLLEDNNYLDGTKRGTTLINPIFDDILFSDKVYI